MNQSTIMLIIERAGLCRSRALLQVIHKENPAINHGWKTQPQRNQQIKPHALPPALQRISEMDPESCRQMGRKMVGLR